MAHETQPTPSPTPVTELDPTPVPQPAPVGVTADKKTGSPDSFKSPFSSFPFPTGRT